MVFRTCGPNEAMVVSGCFHSKPQYVCGGRIFVIPCIQNIQKISLNTMTLQIQSEHVYTQLGVAISVTGIAQVKIQGSNSEMLQVACQQFLGKNEEEIKMVAQETLEGHQRAIMGNMTVEEIYKDRKKFSKAVFEVASSDLVNMGIAVVSYTLKDVKDDEGYLKALGMGRTAEVKRDASIGEAIAKRDAGIKEAQAEEEKMAAKYLNEIEIAKAKRDFELNKAAFNKEVNTKNAFAELAYSLQAAKTQQAIKEEEMEVKVVERKKQISIQEQEIVRKEKELEAIIMKPAEAEKYKMEKMAEANKNKILMEAEAESQVIKKMGDAKASAIKAMAKAEAENMEKKAEAWKEYKDAAVVDMVMGMMPKLAAEIASPLSNTENIKMVSVGRGEVGVAKLTNEVLDVMEKLPMMIQNVTGVNITQTLKQRK